MLLGARGDLGLVGNRHDLGHFGDHGFGDQRLGHVEAAVGPGGDHHQFVDGAGLGGIHAGSVACSYFRSEGTSSAAAIAASTQSAPPVQTEKRTPASFAITPASTSPSCGPPMKNIMFTEVMRPRSWSGVRNWRRVWRITMLMGSAAPGTASIKRLRGNQGGTPKTPIPPPRMAAAVSS